MSKGISLHIGLNEIDPRHYAGSAGRLTGCHNDAIKMLEIAKSRNFSSLKDRDNLFLPPGFGAGKGSEATRQNVISYISGVANELKSGDIFFMSFSGHGGQLPNLNQDGEFGRVDQTFCLYDAMLVDDEINKLLKNFAAGVRVLIIADSCYSGSVNKIFRLQNEKYISDTILQKTYQDNLGFYNPILIAPYNSDKTILASVILISSSQDDEVSLDGPVYSAFTKKLLKVWDRGAFKGSYPDFIKQIGVVESQHPKLVQDGNRDNKFLNSNPFSI